MHNRSKRLTRISHSNAKNHNPNVINKDNLLSLRYFNPKIPLLDP